MHIFTVRTLTLAAKDVLEGSFCLGARADFQPSKPPSGCHGARQGL